MIRIILLFLACLAPIVVFAPAAHANGNLAFAQDIIATSDGDLKITFIGHGSLILTFKEKVIHVDPYSKLADYNLLPKADAVLITHQHQDHLDLAALAAIIDSDTDIVLNAKSAEILGRGRILNNWQSTELIGIPVEVVPAYNLVHKRDTGEAYHPKGEGNGYILTFGDKRIYIAGDTENYPEMTEINNIDIAFLPMNLPYTMTPEMVKAAALVIKPKTLYPYHFSDTDTNKLLELMKDNQEIEIKIRNMQ